MAQSGPAGFVSRSRFAHAVLDPVDPCHQKVPAADKEPIQDKHISPGKTGHRLTTNRSRPVWARQDKPAVGAGSTTVLSVVADSRQQAPSLQQAYSSAESGSWPRQSRSVQLTDRPQPAQSCSSLVCASSLAGECSSSLDACQASGAHASQPVQPGLRPHSNDENRVLELGWPQKCTASEHMRQPGPNAATRASRPQYLQHLSGLTARNANENMGQLPHAETATSSAVPVVLPPIYIPCHLGAVHRPAALSQQRDSAAAQGASAATAARRSSRDNAFSSGLSPSLPQPPLGSHNTHQASHDAEARRLSSPEALGQLRGKLDRLLSYQAPTSPQAGVEDDGFPDIQPERSFPGRQHADHGQRTAALLDAANGPMATSSASHGPDEQRSSHQGLAAPELGGETGLAESPRHSLAYSNPFESSLPASGHSDAPSEPGPPNGLHATCPPSARSPPLKPVKGQLQFYGGFEGGNIGSVTALEGGGEYELRIRPDTLAPRFRLWFHFQVTNCLAGQQVVLSIVNFSKTRSLYRHHMTPVVRSRSQPTWARLPSANVFYYRCPKRKMAYVLSMVFTFDRTGDVYEFAYSFPYSYTHLQHLLAVLEERQLPFVTRSLLCRSPQLRRTDVITLEEGPPGTPAAPRKLVCLTARVHPGETPASYVMEGLLSLLASSTPDAQRLRQLATWVLVPMLNPDGCFLGNYRSDAGGMDLNRLWARPNADLEPALFRVLSLLDGFAADECFDLDMFVDIHAHSTTRAGFMFCNPPALGCTVGPDLDRVNRLPRILDARMPGFALANCQWDASACKAGCARRVVGARFPSMLAYTLEISFFNSLCSSATQTSSQGFGPLPPPPVEACNTQEGYYEMGRQLAKSFVTFYETA